MQGSGRGEPSPLSPLLDMGKMKEQDEKSKMNLAF